MELITKLEHLVAGWTKNVPHLPAAGQRWLGQNVWWMILIVTILTGISVLVTLNELFRTLTLLGSVNAAVYSYYAVAHISALTIVSLVVMLAFGIGVAIVAALSIKPLQLMQKRGWTLLFVAWLLEAAAIIVNTILGFSIFSIIGILFGAIFLAAIGYFIFEIRGQFAHVTRKAKTAKTTPAA